MVAAGSGTRLQAGRPKAFVELRGETLLDHALRRVRASRVVDEVVVVHPPSLKRCVSIKESGAADLRAVPGGPTRQASVHRGLAALSDDVDVVLVHDAARCLAPASLFATVAAAVRAGHDAVVPGVPVVDTVRDVEAGVVPRDRLRAVQTPQGFARATLDRAHAAAAEASDDRALAATDDAGLVERVGGAVHVVDGAAEAFKITTPTDLLLAGAVLDTEEPA